MALRWRVGDPSWLRESIIYTARDTGFSARLIEKDYFCSVLLEYLAANSCNLVFKGGTCLSKVHTDFYRLSEDLDFSIPMPAGSSRPNRKRESTKLKFLINGVATALPMFRIVEPLTGANGSTQYNVVFGYASLLDERIESVKVEVGLREPGLIEPMQGAARTLLINPIKGNPLIETFPVSCLAWLEAMAEKLRAALCRRNVAIRDFFDVDYAVNHAKLNLGDASLLELLRRKIAVPGTMPVDVTVGRLTHLQRQLEAQLRPVLREQDFVRFDIERAVETVRRIAREVA